jgi:hypothetical protein
MRPGFIMFRKERLTRLSSVNKPAGSFFLILFFLVTILPRLSAQHNQPILFHGVIFDSDTRQPLAGAHYHIRGRTAGAADSRGMVSFYAHYDDTVTFSCVGFKDYHMIVSDTLRAREYIAGIYLTSDTLMIPAVVVMPRLTNIRAEILADRPADDHEMINAANNLKISTYQGLTGANKLGDPAANYEVIRQQQRIDTYEKGGIPSSAMVSVSPFTLIPLIYVLAKGLPREPEPPSPYISPREMNRIQALHDSLIYKRKLH